MSDGFSKACATVGFIAHRVYHRANGIEMPIQRHRNQNAYPRSQRRSGRRSGIGDDHVRMPALVRGAGARQRLGSVQIESGAGLMVSLWIISCAACCPRRLSLAEPITGSTQNGLRRSASARFATGAMDSAPRSCRALSVASISVTPASTGISTAFADCGELRAHAPAGLSRRKSDRERPRSSISATAMALRSTVCSVVDEVGSSWLGQASPTCCSFGQMLGTGPR